MKMRYIRKKEKALKNQETYLASEYCIPNKIPNFANTIQRPITQQQMVGCYSPQPSVEQVMRQFNNVLNNPWNPDTYKLVYESKDCELFFAYIPGEEAWKYVERKKTDRKQTNFNHGIDYVKKIREEGKKICGPIWFVDVEPYIREDKPGKLYFVVCFQCELSGRIEKKIVEKNVVDGDDLCRAIKSEIVENGNEIYCSIFYRTEIYRLSKGKEEIMIPMFPGWYKDDKYGMIYLEKESYSDYAYELPEGINVRRIGKTERYLVDVYKEIEPIIHSNIALCCLFTLKMVESILVMLEKWYAIPHEVISLIVDNIKKSDIATAVLKTNEFTSLNKSSLNMNSAYVEKECLIARDGIAVIMGPKTVNEAKTNGKTSRKICDIAIGANGTGYNSRCMIAMIERFVPQAFDDESVFLIDCTDIPISIDLKHLRSLMLEMSAAFIAYIEDNYEKVELIVKRTVDKCRSSSDVDVPYKTEDMYISFMAVKNVFHECFGIELYNEEQLFHINQLFTKDSVNMVYPDYTVRDEFICVTKRMIWDGKFKIIERNEANNNYNNGTTLILDRKKDFLSFDISAIEKISAAITTVKDGAELTGVLKACNSIFCTDNGARQITAAGKRQAFYSVYLSEFGDAIFDIIDMFDKEEFFFHPEKVPDNFLPLIWYNGYCAGIVIDGEGLPNPHCNISGLSGMGKNRGAYRIAEGYRRLRTKVVFLDIKGGTTEDALKDMECDLSKYIIYDFKEEGFPFPIFNVSDFNGKNGKVSYILNVISAAVDLTELQIYELSDYINDMIDEETRVFSLAELLERIPTKKCIGLKNKIQPLLHLLNAYTPKDGKYKYSSYKEFVCDTDMITNLSITQISDAALQTVVYTLLQSIFEHQILNSSNRIVVFADEMQKYTADCPFKKMFAEGRQFNICMIGMTQEYRSKDNATRKDTSNASTEIFYVPATDSLKRVFDALGKKYNADEHQSKGRGYIWCKGYFWSNVDNKHKFVVLKGKNDDPDFYKLNSSPKGYYGNAI